MDKQTKELPIKLWVGEEYLGEFRDAGAAEDAVFDSLTDDDHGCSMSAWFERGVRS